MTTREHTSVAFFSFFSNVAISIVAAPFLALFALGSIGSTGLASTPAMLEITDVTALIANECSLDSFGYELCSLFSATQGLHPTTGLSLGAFNPGSDIDLTTTTDFEDLAAPVADIMEFMDQDRAMTADAVAVSVFRNGVCGLYVGSALTLLSPKHWRNTH